MEWRRKSEICKKNWKRRKTVGIEIRNTLESGPFNFVLCVPLKWKFLFPVPSCPHKTNH